MTQSISLNPSVGNLRITSDNFLRFDVIYTSDNPDLPGLSLRLLYDDQQMTLEKVDPVFAKDRNSSGTPPLIAGQNLQTADDTTNLGGIDGDAATNTIFNQAWADIAGEFDWPGEVPATLYSVEFKVADGVTNPVLRFVGGAAQGQTFDAPGTPDKDAIIVSGVNTPPAFDPLTYEVSLVEGSTGNVVTVIATDPDTTATFVDTLTYSIADGNLDVDSDGNLAFAIDGSSGLITVNDSDDLKFGEVPGNEFTLSVAVKDTLNEFAAQNATVTVDITAEPVPVDFNFFTLEAGQGLQVTNVQSNAALNNLVAAYRVDGPDANGVIDGSIDGVKPGDAGYVAKALARIETDVLLRGQGEGVAGEVSNSSAINNTGGTAYYGAVLIANGGKLDNLLDFLEVNSGNTIGDDIRQIAAYFSFEAANATRDGVTSIGDNFKFNPSTGVFGVEDLHSSFHGDGEPDFNDLTAQINII